MHKLTREVEYLTKVVKILERENAELKDQLGAAQYAVRDIVSHVEGTELYYHASKEED